MTKTDFKSYYRLTKPGIIQANVMTAAAGFLFASTHHIDLKLLVATLAGTALIIASACVVNNYTDRGIDSKMARTKKRATVTGEISTKNTLLFATILGLLGIIILIKFANKWPLIIGLLAFIDYVILYGIAKRTTIHSTLVGTIAGSASIVAGYCAVTQHISSQRLSSGWTANSPC
jgi:protoheme IX farnesyltransferase